MNYFWCEVPLKLDTPAHISGENARHIRDSRRMKVNDEIIVQDPTPVRYRARIHHIDRTSVILIPFEILSLPVVPRHTITLLQAYVAQNNVDLIIQKATELGVSHIVLFTALYSPHGIHTDRADHKHSRWHLIMRAACEQSGRPTPPQLTLASSLQDALNHLHGTLVVLDENGTKDMPITDTLTLVVGPEGGLSTEEKEIVRHAGAHALAIGPYTLRAETAAIAGLAVCS